LDWLTAVVLPWSTFWVNVALVLPAKVALPLYVAMMACEPGSACWW